MLREVESLTAEQTNDRLYEPLTLVDIIRWIGIWFLLVTVSENSWKVFGSSRSVSKMEGSPFLFNGLMSCEQFEKILANLTYTDELPPLFVEKLEEVT